MSEYSINEIYSMDDDWGLDVSTGLPYSKGAVQRFIKQMISQQISQMSEKIGWLQFEGTRIGFYDAPDGIKLGAVELSGIVYTINYTSDTNTNFFVLVSDEHKYITITPSSESGTIGGKMNEFIEDYEYTFSVDNGSGSYKQFKAGDCMNGESFKEDIRNYLTVGNNRIRVIITGKESTQSRSIIFIVTLTNLQLTCNMSWWKPFINGENYYIDKIFFGGNLNKTLNIKIDDDESQLYSINFTSSTNYLSSEYSYNMTNKFPKGGTGVHKVDVWMTGEGVETSHYKFNIMCIDTPDINNKSLVCINEIKDKAVNFDNQTLFKYATYNAISVNFDITCNDNGNNIVVIENQTIKVQTQTRNSYDIGFEINTESKENVSIAVNVSVQDFNQQFTLPLDNTNSYAAVDNPTFYLNCTNRSNGSLNKTEFINSSNVTGAVSSYSANFTGFAWSTDGWATDNDGNKCLVVNAGSYVEVPDFKPLSSAAVYNKTIEFKFRCSNVADYDTPVMSFMDTETYDPLRTNGIILFPTKILVLSTSNRQVTPQSVNLNEDSITHVTIVLQRNYANKGKNLCRIYINSYQNAVFEYSGNASFGDGYLKMGQESADFYLYMMRLYDNRVLEENDVLGNFLNVLIDDKEFTRSGVRKDNNILDSGEINYDMCKKAGYNIMTIKTDNDLPIPSIEYTSTVNSTLSIEYNDHPEWNFTITKAPLGGQGTTSMKYYRWNLRWKLKDKSIWTYADNSTTSKSGWFDGKDNHPKMNKITAKKNYASSMQGHKMGACKLYDELYYRLGFKTALPSETCRVAVFQYPVMGFQKFSDGSYSFIGLYTIGPDKGDSKTFGYDGDKYPNFLSLEGPNHNPLGTRFLHPWTENTQYDPDDETLKFGGQEGWDVDACPYETDVAEDRQKIQTLLESEWKPAYDIVYYCSPYLISLAEAGFASISELNSNLNTFRNGMTIMSNRKNEVFQLYDSSYNLIHYDNTAGCYITLPHNILSYLAGYLMTSNPSTEELIQARKQKFYIESENYWSIPVALYRSCFLDLIGGSDNHAKNSYPFKFKSLYEGGRWCWRDDDLDTVLATDNNGQSTKPYGIEVGDVTSDGTDIFQGSSSVFWTLIDDVFKNEKSSTMKKVISVLCEMAADVKLSSAYMHDTVYNIIGSYFWGNSSEYFPSLSYNKDATWCYITPWNIDPNKSYNNVYPLTQALGTQKDAEELWLYRRIIYIMSKYEIGGFTGSQHDGFNAIEFTPAKSFTFNITPSQDMYPSANKGGGENINGGRTKAGETCQILADSDGSTTFYLKGMDLYTDIGDLSGLVLTTRGGDTSTGAGFSVIGNKLRSIKIGDADPSKVSFNASRFNISGKSLEYIDARNVTTLVSDVLLFDCPRLKKVYFQGTNASTIYLPMGAKITEIGYPTGIKTLFLHSLPMLDDEGILISDESINSLTGLYYYNCPNISPFDLLRKIYNQGQNLHFVTLIWDDVIEGTAADLDMFAEFTNPYNPATNTGYGCIEFNPDTNQISNSTLRADFQGVININGYTYKDSFDALKNYFGNQLQISCLGYYIRFKDKQWLDFIAQKFGDGIGTIQDNLDSVTTINGVFTGEEINAACPNLDILDMSPFKNIENFYYHPSQGWKWNTTATKVYFRQNIDIPSGNVNIGQSVDGVYKYVYGFGSVNHNYKYEECVVIDNCDSFWGYFFRDVKYGNIYIKNDAMMTGGFSYASDPTKAVIGFIYVQASVLEDYLANTNWVKHSAKLKAYDFNTDPDNILPEHTGYFVM